MNLIPKHRTVSVSDRGNGEYEIVIERKWLWSTKLLTYLGDGSEWRNPNLTYNGGRMCGAAEDQISDLFRKFQFGITP